MLFKKCLFIQVLIGLFNKSCLFVSHAKTVNNFKSLRQFASSLSVCLAVSALPTCPCHAATNTLPSFTYSTPSLIQSSTISTNTLLSTSSVLLSKSNGGGTEEISILPLKSWISDEFTRGLVSGAVSRASKEILLHPIDTIRARLQINFVKKKKNNNDVNLFNNVTTITSTNTRGISSIKKATIITSKTTSTTSITPTVSSSNITSATNTNKRESLLFQNLYAGLMPALVGGIPAGAVFFAIKDTVKSYLKSADSTLITFTLPSFLSLSSVVSFHDPSTLLLSSIHHFSKEEATILSVMAANVFYWIIRSPTEELKTKQQVGQNATNFTSLSYLSNIYQSQGISGVIQQFYGSYPSNILYALPADILKFLAYEFVSTNIYHAGTGTGVKISGIDAAVAGSISGLFAQTLTTPLDVARTRIMTRQSSKKGEDKVKMKTMNTKKNTISIDTNGNTKKANFDTSTQQKNAIDIKEKQNIDDVEDNPDTLSSSSSSSSTNIFTVMQGIIATEGIPSLFRGILPRAARAIGSGAIQFASYELTQNAMK